MNLKDEHGIQAGFIDAPFFCVLAARQSKQPLFHLARQETLSNMFRQTGLTFSALGPLGP